MPGKLEVCTRSVSQRPRYAPGQLLTAEDLQLAQDYHAGKVRQLTRVVFGVGVVEGLGISTSGSQVTVSSGVAVDGMGRLLELSEACQFASPAGGAAWNVFIGMEEVTGDPQPSMIGGLETVTGSSPRRIQEVIKLWIEAAAAKPGAPSTGAVWLGKIQAGRKRGRSVAGKRKQAARKRKR
jgi:hypothetical protein